MSFLICVAALVFLMLVAYRGFSVILNEWHHNPKYAERSKYVPKY